MFWVFCEDKTTQTDRQLWISKVNRTQIFYSWVYGLNIDPHLNTRLWRIWGKMTKFNMFLSSRMMLDNSITLPYSLVPVTPEIHGCHVFFRKRSIRRAFAMSLGTQILRSRNPLVPTCVGCWSSIYICVKILYIYIHTVCIYIYIYSIYIVYIYSIYIVYIYIHNGNGSKPGSRKMRLFATAKCDWICVVHTTTMYMAKVW